MSLLSSGGGRSSPPLDAKSVTIPHSTLWALFHRRVGLQCGANVQRVPTVPAGRDLVHANRTYPSQPNAVVEANPRPRLSKQAELARMFATPAVVLESFPTATDP